MSILSVALPAQLAFPAVEVFAGTAISVARPLLRLSVLALLLMMFKPLLVGMLRAALLLVKPRRTLEEREARRKMQGAMMLSRMARQYDSIQPNLAAELRSIAARG